MDRRAENLRLLAIFHFVYAGLIGLGSLVPLTWVLVAAAWWPAAGGEYGGADVSVPVIPTVVVIVGAALVAWTWAGLLIVAGRNLLARRHHTFCLVVAAIACLSVPLGTALGVSTLVLLNRDEMRAAFEEPAAA